MATAAAAVDLPRLVQYVKRFPSLHTLHLASLRLHGQLPTDLATQLKQLRYLNISGNPGVSGTLPKTWAALTSLQHLDVSGCSVSGPLPEGYAALQMLRIFRASRTLLSGSLPKSWGLLSSLHELDISHANLTGGFPAWGSAAAMQTMAAAKATAAKAAAAQAVATAAAAGEVLVAAGEQQARVTMLQAALEVLHNDMGSADQPIVAVAMDGVDPMQALRAGVVQYRQALDMANAATAIAESLQAASNAAAAAADKASEMNLDDQAVEDSAKVSTAATDMHNLALRRKPTPKMGNSTEGVSVNKLPVINSTDAAATYTSVKHQLTAAINSSAAATTTGAVALGAISNTPATAVIKTSTAGTNIMSDATQPLSKGAWPTPYRAENLTSLIAQAGTRQAAIQVEEVRQLSSSGSPSASASSAQPGFMPLKVLRLHSNRLSGRLPDDISNLQHLRTLDLSGNDLSGSLPNSLAELAGLQVGVFHAVPL